MVSEALVGGTMSLRTLTSERRRCSVLMRVSVSPGSACAGQHAAHTYEVQTVSYSDSVK
jgi:hypothetical protein